MSIRLAKLLRFFTLLFSATFLVSCGGGNTAAPIVDAAAPAIQAAQLSRPLSIQSSQDPLVVGLTKVSERRVSRTEYEYTFTVTVQNGPWNLTGATAALLSAGRGTTILQSVVSVGDLASWTTKKTAETITIRQDRTLPFNKADLVWDIAGTRGSVGNAPGPFVLLTPNPRKVTPVLGAGATTQVVTSAAGGTLTATGADGAQYTLVIPPNALLTDTEITMTPVAAIPDLPFSGGFVAGVQLEPSGLNLLQAATLTIVPTISTASVMPIGFGYQENGKELQLVQTPYGLNSTQLNIFHFSGYGIGLGTIQELINQINSAPALSLAQLDQQLAQLFAQERQAQQLGLTTNFDSYISIIRLFGSFYDTVLLPEINFALAVEDYRLITQALRDALELERKFQLLGHSGVVSPAEFDALGKAQINVGARTYYAACANDHDLTAVGEIMRVARQALLLGISETDPLVTQAFTLIDKCLTFKLTFDIAYQEVPLQPYSGIYAHLTGEAVIHSHYGDFSGLYGSNVQFTPGYIRVADCLAHGVDGYADCSPTVNPTQLGDSEAVFVNAVQFIGMQSTGNTSFASFRAVIGLYPYDIRPNYTCSSTSPWCVPTMVLSGGDPGWPYNDPTNPLYAPYKLVGLPDVKYLMCAPQIGLVAGPLAGESHINLSLWPLGGSAGPAHLMTYTTSCQMPWYPLGSSSTVTFNFDHAPGS
jgi:hypothetical protein